MTPEPSRLTAAALWCYRAAVRVLPRAFRKAHDAELVACFAAIADDARMRGGRLAVARVAARALADLLARSWSLRRRSRREAQSTQRLWTGLGADLQHAVRRFRRRPAFSSTAVVTLGLGLAAATSVFSLVHGVILNPLSYPEPDRIVDVDHAGPGVGTDRGLGITFGFYRHYAAHVSGADAWAMYNAIDLTLAGAGDPVRLTGARTTASLGAVLRTAPVLGRWLDASDEAPGATLAVVLSDRLWRERFGGQDDVIGRRVELEGVLREIVGVMPRSFAFPVADTAFWIPRMVPATGVGGWNEHALARLAPGVDPAALERAIVSSYAALRETTDDPARVAAYLDDARVAPIVRPLKDTLVGGVAATLWTLLLTVGVVLAVAVANVANLFLIRTEEGRHELTVRRALGAGRARLARSSLIEGVLVALVAGASGLAASAAAIRVVQAASPAFVPRLEEVGLTPPVVMLSLIFTLAAGTVLGLLPVVARGVEDGGSRQEPTRWATAGRTTRRGRDILMAAQVALALVLLIGSGLLFRTYTELRAVELGFAERQALVFDVSLPSSRYPTRADARAFHTDVLDRLRALPGVRSAAAVGMCLPLSGNMCWGEALAVEGRPAPEGQIPPITGARAATSDYFRTMGIRVRGRTFTAADEAGDAGLVILSEATAAAYFPGEEPIGRRVGLGAGQPWHTIVGVAADVRGRIESDNFQRLIYLPLRSGQAGGPPISSLVYVLGTVVPPLTVAASARSVVADVDPAIPLAGLRTLQAHIDRATAPAGFALSVIGAAALIALALGVVGVYAVVAYAVSRRSVEIGVRMAVGASPAAVGRLVLREGGAVVLTGVAAGLAAAFGLSHFLEGLLFGVSPTEPATFAGLTAVLLASAGAALWLPARRAARVDAAAALRAG